MDATQTAISLDKASKTLTDAGRTRSDDSVLLTEAAREAGIPMEMVTRSVKTRLTLSDDGLGLYPRQERRGPPPRRG